MSRDSLVTASMVLVYSILIFAVGIYAGRKSVKCNAFNTAEIQLLENQIQELQGQVDSLATVADGHAAESEFWRIQAAVTNQLLADNAAALDSFNRLNPQRHAQRMFIAGAAAAELDSFFAARYPGR